MSGSDALLHERSHAHARKVARHESLEWQPADLSGWNPESTPYDDLQKWERQGRVDRLRDLIPFWQDGVLAAERGEEAGRMEEFLERLEDEWNRTDGYCGQDGNDGWGRDTGEEVWGGGDIWGVQTGEGGRQVLVTPQRQQNYSEWGPGERDWGVSLPSISDIPLQSGNFPRQDVQSAKARDSRTKDQILDRDRWTFVETVAKKEAASVERTRHMHKFYDLPTDRKVREIRQLIRFLQAKPHVAVTSAAPMGQYKYRSGLSLKVPSPTTNHLLSYIMNYDSAALPDGWSQEFDQRTQHPFWVDTRAQPPRSIWVHPFEDEVFLREHPDIRKRLVAGELNDQPPPYSPRRHSYSGSSSSGATLGVPNVVDRNAASQPGTPAVEHRHRGFLNKLKDKTLGTREEREATRRREEAMRQEMRARRQQQYETQARNDRSWHASHSYGNPRFAGQSMYGPPLGDPYAYRSGIGGLGSGYGSRNQGMGGMGLPLLGGMAGGLLLGEVLDDFIDPGFGGGGLFGGGGFDGGFGGGFF
ncbi:uncharacterized protein FIBRA_07388 [Fibroporia radiculosa]|uniref:WW domain-containing protein n=1 Tax=Fibroporia radiculosa TaxID=599839 RepID=J4H4L1_9APHY|nr:uncharacterized protein FIBRA_07388 [Fibroporia radiculosa]CCM05179.1 predicted protein [Fibroporia radiculosa]